MDKKIIADLSKELNIYRDFIYWFLNKYFKETKNVGFFFNFINDARTSYMFDISDWEWTNKSYSKDKALFLLWKIDALHLFFTKRCNYYEEYGFRSVEGTGLINYIKTILNEIKDELIVVNNKCDNIFDKWKTSKLKVIDYKNKIYDGQLIEDIKYFNLSKK